MYWRALDGLRGVAVLMVVVDHASGQAGGLGVAGVAIFFVLSGFLITNVIVEARHRREWSMGRFVMARVVRLVPALLVMQLGVGCWWLLAGRPWSDIGWQMLASTLYAENFFHAQFGDYSLLNHTWSLAVEEQFYLLWPLALPLVMRMRSPRLVVAGAVLASVALRLGLSLASADFPGLGPWAFASLPANAFALLLGCMLVIDPAHFSAGRAQRIIPLACLAAITALATGLAGVIASSFIVAPILVGLLAVVMVAFSLPGVPVLEVSALRFVGRISYALYLWHWPVLVLLDEPAGGVSAVPGVLLSFVLAVVSTMWIEEPLRRRWRARHRTDARPATVQGATKSRPA